jgi:hypothetical protein
LARDGIADNVIGNHHRVNAGWTPPMSLRFVVLKIALLIVCAIAIADAAHAQHQPLVRPGPCAQGYVPVCAVKQKTLVTYVNACAARGVNARVIELNRACLEACERKYQPVCATDGDGKRRVFGNACEAEKSGATDIRKGSCRRFLRRI